MRELRWKNVAKAELAIARCRELLNTGILIDGKRNVFDQSVFIEVMLLLASVKNFFRDVAMPGVEMRNIVAHPDDWKSRQIGDTGIILSFGRTFLGGWQGEWNSGNFFRVSEDCDIEYQYGETSIKYSDIEKIVRACERQLMFLDSRLRGNDDKRTAQKRDRAKIAANSVTEAPN